MLVHVVSFHAIYKCVLAVATANKGKLLVWLLLVWGLVLGVCVCW